jgi:hypothetical protein
MDDNKGFFTKKFTAEFNTGQDTLRQLAQMEWNLDNMFAMIYSDGINTMDISRIDTLYHYLLYVYADRLWSMSWSVLQENTDEKETTFTKYEKEIEEMYNDWKKHHAKEVPKALLRKLREYKRWLYEVKQKKIKLGVPTKVETTAKERLQKAMGV